MAVAQAYGKTVTSGSVFAYDTEDTRNSYAGEPTVNVFPDPKILNGTSGWGISNATGGTTTVDTGRNGGQSIKVTVASGGDQYQYRGYGHGVNKGGSTFTYSAYIRTSAISGTGVGMSTYWFDINGNWIFTNNTASARVTGTQDWTRVTATSTAPAGTYYTIAIFYPVDKNGVGTYWITDVQIEEKSYVTPFVVGIRSVTQGLLPLVSKSEISLALASFDSDAQISLDGTGDFIRIDQDGNYFQPSFTWEMVVKFTSIQNTYQGLVWAEGSTLGGAYSGEQYLLTLYNNQYFHYRIQNATTGWTNTDTSTIDFNPQLYNHIVWQFSNGTTNIYINGNLFHTDTSRGAYNGSKFSPFFLGARNDGAYSSAIKMPVARLYNRILSADEVKQNFNFYDARFGIEVDPYYFVVSNRFSRSIWTNTYGYTKIIADTTPAYIIYQKPDATIGQVTSYTTVASDPIGSPPKTTVLGNQYVYGSGRFLTTVNAYRSKKGNRLSFTFPDGRTSTYGEAFYKGIVTPYVP